MLKYNCFLLLLSQYSQSLFLVWNYRGSISIYRALISKLWSQFSFQDSLLYCFRCYSSQIWFQSLYKIQFHLCFDIVYSDILMFLVFKSILAYNLDYWSSNLLNHISCMSTYYSKHQNEHLSLIFPLHIISLLKIRSIHKGNRFHRSSHYISTPNS